MSFEEGLSGPTYHNVKEIGRGGVGIVHEAQDLRIQRPVAKKVLRLGKNAPPHLRQRFIREARVTGQLQHPNIVPIYELSRDDEGEVFYTMRLVEGISLADALNGLRNGQPDPIHRFPLRALLTIFLKVCDAVAFAHSRGVIHRDLKPANIMIGEYGEVLVMDWGLAKCLHGEPDAAGPAGEPKPAMAIEAPDDGFLTLDGDILGTPNFMAPEQAEGRPDAINARTDVYALGAILYNLLTLQPPVHETSIEKVLQAIRSGEIRPPTSFNPTTRRTGSSRATTTEKPPSSSAAPDTKTIVDSRAPGAESRQPIATPALLETTLPHCPGHRIPASLSAVSMKALAVNPGDRYPSVQELQREVESYLSGFATRAERAGAWTQVRLFVQRNRAVSLATGIALLVLFVVSLTSAWVNYQEKVRTQQAFHSYLAEQQQRQQDRRQSAPIFLASARKALALSQFDEAQAHAEVAAEFDPELPEPWLLKAHLAITGRDYAAAAEALRIYANLKPSDREAAQLLYSVEQVAEKESPERVSALFEVLVQQKAFAAAAAMSQSPENQLRLYREQIDSAWRGQDGNLKPDGQGGFQFSLTHSFPKGEPVNLDPLSGVRLASLHMAGYSVRDLSPLQSMALTNVAFPMCQIADLSPLKGQPLRAVDLWRTSVQGLGPLEDAPLEYLNVAETSVSDLSPLRGLPLKFLNVYRTGVSDLAPLAGMPLEFLNIASTPVTDLTPIRGMPLTNLDLFEAPVSSISALTGMPLRWLNLARTRITDLTPLEGMPLQFLDLWEAPVVSIAPLAGLPLGTLNLAQTLVKDLSPLTGLPLTNLNVSATGITDIRPLAKLKLDSLNLSDTHAIDLSPLRGSPLTRLDLYHSRVVDLSPLAGMKLRWLKLSACAFVKDLAPLRGLPLVMLDLYDTGGITDFSPLKDCPQLEELYLPRDATGIDFLKTHPSLKWITCEAAEFTGHPPTQSAAEFWEKRDRSLQHRP